MANREEGERRLMAARDSVLGWVRSELTDVATQFGDGNALRMEVRNAAVPTNDNILNVQTSERDGYRSIGGLELSLREAGDGFHRRHLLQMLLCCEWQDVYTANVVTGGMGGNSPEPVEPSRDVQLALLPMYRQTVDHEAPRASQMLGYLSKPEKVGKNMGQVQLATRGGQPGLRQPPGVEFFRVEPVTASFHDDVTQFAPFRLSEWPVRQEELGLALATAVGSFLKVVQKGIRVIDR